MIDINLLRVDKGGNPERVCASQRRRSAPAELIDEVIGLDKEWRRRQYELENLRKESKALTKQIGVEIRNKKDPADVKSKKLELDQKIVSAETGVGTAKFLLDSRLSVIGNLVHDSVPVDEENVIRSWGVLRREQDLLTHASLTKALGIADAVKGAAVGGQGCSYMSGSGVLLIMALRGFAMDFLSKRGYEAMKLPSFMISDVMKQCAKLDEGEHHKVGGGSKYLAAAPEELLAAYHRGEWMHPKALPIRYAGLSPCFPKGGSNFTNIGQFYITSPLGDTSWKMHEEMLKDAEDFYQELGIPCRVVSIVAASLNAASAKTYVLEGWFPGSQQYGVLASCSNCTDYQARKLDIRYGQTTANQQQKQFVHMLDSTLVTEQTLCCLLENYQTDRGVRIPQVLQDKMLDEELIPFTVPSFRKHLPGNPGPR